MVRLHEIQIREQVYPDPDYKHLDLVKINPDMTDADCQRIIDLLKRENVPSSINHNKVMENKNVTNSKQQNHESKYVEAQPVVKKQRRLDQIKPETTEIECIPINSIPPPKLKPISSDKFEKPVAKLKQISSFLIEPPPSNPKIAQDSKMAFQVIYGRYKPYKKNKEWTYDGFLEIEPKGITLYKCTGTVESRLDRTANQVPKHFSSGTHLVIGQYECEICNQLVYSEFKSDAYFAPDD